MEGVLQSVKAFFTALASQLSSLIKDQTDSTTAKIHHVMESVTEALLVWWKNISQKKERKKYIFQTRCRRFHMMSNLEQRRTARMVQSLELLLSLKLKLWVVKKTSSNRMPPYS
ncbi:unnamed protein product [Brassica oleracea var. botrytis]